MFVTSAPSRTILISPPGYFTINILWERDARETGAMATRIEEALARLRRDYKQRAEGMLDDLEQALRETDFDDAPAVAVLERRVYGDAHSLKGGGGTAGFPFVSRIAHRLEEYLEARERRIAPGDIDALHRFFDAIRDVLDGGQPSGEAEARRVLDGLPAPAGPSDPERVEPPAPAAPATPVADAGAPLEALLVSLSKTSRAIVGRALEEQGLAVTAVAAASDGLAEAVRRKPAVVVLPGVMRELNATDFVAALKAMTPTRTAWIGVVTSLDAGHETMRDLPPDCRVFRQTSRLFRDIEHFLAEADLRARA
jgi:chemotaxis protein histidine kinase CheA